MSSTTETEVISENIEVDELEKLLELAEAQEYEANINENKSKVVTPCLKDDDTFIKSFESFTQSLNDGKNDSKELNDIEDSSDDEDIRNFLEQKYNEYGRDINKKLKQQNEEKKELEINREINRSYNYERTNNLSKSFTNCSNLNSSDSSAKDLLFKKDIQREARQSFNIKINLSKNAINKANPLNTIENILSNNVYTDPIFGMRLINPLISSSSFTERMSGRKAVAFSSLDYHIQCSDKTKDWVIAGAILTKSPAKTAKNGSSYSIWRLSDLKGDIKTLSLFIFKNAHKDLWKTAIGMVIAILNPDVFEKRTEKNDVACLCIDNPQKVMILGQSKDMGTCRAKKKNGEPCGVYVNLGQCDYCIYHVKQEYGKMSRRSELQSATAGRGLNELRNKVLGKNEVFYGGQSFTAIPAKKSAKQTAKDQHRLMTLSDYYQSPNENNVSHVSSPRVGKEIPYAKRVGGPTSNIAANIEFSNKQRLKDLERLKLLQGEKSNENCNKIDENVSSSKLISSSSSIPEKFRNKEFSFSQKPPTLSQDNFSLEVNIPSKRAELAKQKALKIIKTNPLEKTDPNFIKHRGTIAGKKRAITELNSLFETGAKKCKLQENNKEDERKTRIQKIIEATSSHVNLIRARESEEQEKYFNKLEKKEAMEEKMLNTFKIACKAVICKKCKYTAFSAADRCKDEKHPLKVIDAEKRFFQCEDCGNRTATVHKIPKLSCKNCQGSHWKRAAMIRDKKGFDPTLNLSIRGDEEKYLGTLNNSISLNLLVPEE